MVDYINECFRIRSGGEEIVFESIEVFDREFNAAGLGMIRDLLKGFDAVESLGASRRDAAENTEW